ncbi:hypothetical protein NBRC10512_006707 [Rhodotorula toruloides]|uniref:RHTO0S30e00958g1_1 n=2 Tax=Rhodotorula toruloides TaxID=5286 RepID=A0A061BNY5_RHOTO|nr:aspartic-type endopeptidase [Rhodotorula toruloides NP11]EMS25574.1 aspartic-type endopeptidase [Rhodotorula toruloides NP11]CDR49719.1 RHTO0S30e00958g1_1 [Rhodotorula toruloides]
MRSFAALAPLALMASASLVDALPSPVRIEGVVPSVTNADGSVNDELLKANMEATFAKYEDLAERSTDSSSKAASLKVRRRDGKVKCKRATTKTIPVDYEGNLGLYNIDIGVGTPAQNLPVILDTGSSDLVIQSACDPANFNNLPVCTAVFDSSKSSTFASTGVNHTVAYVSDSISGTIVTDTVNLGGISIPKQTFLLSPNTNMPLSSGNLGLSLNAQAQLGGTSVLENLRASGNVANSRMGLWLGKESEGSAELTIGDWNTDRYSGIATVYQVYKPNQLGRWAIQLLQILDVKQTPLWTMPASPDTVVFIDSGSSTNYLPRAAAAAAHSAIPGSYKLGTTTQSLNGQTYEVDAYAFPCTNTATFGVSLSRRRNLLLAAEDLIIGTVPGQAGMCRSATYGVDINYGGVQAGILGTPFLRSWYAGFNIGDDAANSHANIFFAPAKHA